MTPFQSFRDYEELIYTLQRKFPAIESSTLVMSRRGRCSALLRGELRFAQGYRVAVIERLSNDSGCLKIESYGYELWRNSEKIIWYDSQPHPNEPKLAGTHPHHKHIPPDIKHHRVSAPNINFTPPNLPVLIREVEELCHKTRQGKGK